jgi:hypothetical protein
MYAQDYYYEYDSGETKETGAPKETNVNKTPGAGEAGHDGVFYTFSYGAAASWLTRQRTVTQPITEIGEEGESDDDTETSNLTYRDFFPGLYLNVEFCNVKNPIKDMQVDIVPLIRLAAFYPLNFVSDTSTINREPQKSENPWHFGIDMLAGVKLELLDSDYIRVNITPALHLLFLNTDNWDYFNLGGAVILGFEAPLNEKWTFLVNGCASIDSGNLGNNRNKEPFDSCSQYQVDIGFRYSAKKRNNFSLFGPKNPKKDTQTGYDEY